LKQEYSFGPKAEDFKSYILKTKSLIDAELSKLVSNLSELNLYPQIEYSVLSEGKRLRPLLVILSAESVGGNRSNVVDLALAFELMHTATLVHDDIIDQDEMRRGKPAVHKKWSVNDAILTGDALIALAVELASSYGETILKTVAHSALELCDGEQMDIKFSLEQATEESYFKRIREKSASLFAASTFSGALAGGGTAKEVKALSEFGEHFGIAYQLRDDLLDLTLKQGVVSKDLKSGRITLPLIHFYANSSLQEKKQVESKLQTLLKGSHMRDFTTAQSIVGILRDAGSVDYCEKKIDDHLQRAVVSISALKDSEYKTYLVEMTRALKTLR